MTNERKRQLCALIPPALALAITGTYLLFFGAYIECKSWLTGCGRIVVASVYPTAAAAEPRPQGEQASPAPSPAEELKEIAAKREELSRRSNELQLRLLDASRERVVRTEALKPAELKDETEELQKLGKVSDAVDKEKTETDETLAALDARKKSLEEGLKADAAGQRDRQEGSRKLSIERHTKRLTWVLFTGLFVLACAAALVIALYLPDLVQRGHVRRARLLLGLAALYVGYGLLRWLFDSAYDTVYEEIVAVLKNDDGYLPRLSGFFDVLGSTAALALAVTTTLLLWHPLDFFRDRPEEFDKKLAQLSERNRLLRVILYAGTILLFVGIVRMDALLTWVQSFVTQAGLQTSVDEFSKVLVSFQGVLYSLLLVAVYLPARQIIAGRARSLPSEDAAGKETKLAAAGFGPDSESKFKDYLPKVAAILAPLFAGPLMELVKNIFG